jgi:hypothetical protein
MKRSSGWSGWRKKFSLKFNRRETAKRPRYYAETYREIAALLAPLAIRLVDAASLSIFTVKLSNAAESKVAWQVEWDRVQRGAEKEGQVAVAIYDQGPLTVEVVDAFQKTFPKIKVNSMRARGSQIAPKIIAERRAEKFLVDLFVGGEGTALNTLHVGKLLDQVKPMLSLPEVIDGSKWW